VALLLFLGYLLCRLALDDDELRREAVDLRHSLEVQGEANAELRAELEAERAARE
jgi:hypothetical protein